MKTLATAMVAGLFLLSSCSKSDDQTADTTNGEKASESENVIQDAINVSSDGLDGSVDGIPNGRIQACATVTNDAVAKILTIDFGTAGCVGADGRSRKGKIAIQYVGTVPQTSPTRSITFTNYSVNNYSITGALSESGYVRSTATSFSFSVAISGLQIVLSDGRTYAISNLQRTYSINLGATVQDISDDVTTITGTSTQTGSTGTTTTVEITSPITFKGSCTSTGNLYPSSGIYKITESNLTYTVDWGTGACDKSITIAVLGRTIVKTLP
ncbi:MAG: hypothetical protein ACKVOQ_05760 [Cyclobacteriaceae bacterium]